MVPTTTATIRDDAAIGARAARWGALALLVRPAYIATEVVVAAATTGGYSFVADSVSRLGEVGCSAAYCSPRHELMNGSFVAFGTLLVAGAVLLSRRLGPWVTALLVVSGASSFATGLAPLDQDATLHALAAAPLFVAQPVALVVLGARLRDERAPAGPGAAGDRNSHRHRRRGVRALRGRRGVRGTRAGGALAGAHRPRGGRLGVAPSTTRPGHSEELSRARPAVVTEDARP